MRSCFKLVWLVSLSFLTLVACNDQCSSELINTSKSPIGYEAGLLRVNCGATTGYSYEVRIAKIGASLLENGEAVLRFDDNHAKDWPSDERNLVKLNWVGSQTLRVRVVLPVRVFREKASIRDVDVLYKFADGTVKL